MDATDILLEFRASLKAIEEMAFILGQDCDEYYKAIQANDSQIYRRAYVRSVFAFIEGVMHSTRAATSHLGMLFGKLTLQEMIVLDGLVLEIGDKGEIKTRTHYPDFKNNLKFTYRTFGRSVGSSFTLNLSGKGWQSLVASVSVRNRLMHPKEIADLFISDQEVKAAKFAFDWYLINHNLAGHYIQKALNERTSASPEEIAELDKTIQDCENELVRRGN